MSEGEQSLIELDSCYDYKVDGNVAAFQKCGFPIKTLGRATLKSGRMPSGRLIREIFERNLIPPKKNAYMLFMLDRIKISLATYDYNLFYPNIRYFYESSKNPNIFMLFVTDEAERTRRYESYECRSPDDLQDIKIGIFKATLDPVRSKRNVKSQTSLLFPIESEKTIYSAKLPKLNSVSVTANSSSSLSTWHSFTSIDHRYPSSHVQKKSGRGLRRIFCETASKLNDSQPKIMYLSKSRSRSCPSMRTSERKYPSTQRTVRSGHRRDPPLVVYWPSE